MVKLLDRINLLRQEYSLPTNRRKFIDRLVHKFSTQRLVAKSRNAQNFKLKDIHLDVPDLVAEAKEFHSKNGYFPISFSKFGSSTKKQPNNSRKILSTIIPGRPYAYNSYEMYLEEYETSRFAITHKKGGWDCYRHIEILESGSFPLMHDSNKIPKGSMFYYPKELFALIYKNYTKYTTFEEESLRIYLEKWFARYLTSEASVQNMMELSGIKHGVKTLKCLFVDLELHAKLDYLSAMVLSGLIAQESMEAFILGQSPEYMFEDYSGDTSELYGRGFGYTRILSPKSRRTVEINSINFEDYDFVVVASASRNSSFLEENRESLQSSKLIILDGADEPISHTQLTWLKSFSNAKIFVRES
jgi:hypothetical protein